MFRIQKNFFIYPVKKFWEESQWLLGLTVSLDTLWLTQKPPHFKGYPIPRQTLSSIHSNRVWIAFTPVTLISAFRYFFRMSCPRCRGFSDSGRLMPLVVSTAMVSLALDCDIMMMLSTLQEKHLTLRLVSSNAKDSQAQWSQTAA